MIDLGLNNPGASLEELEEGLRNAVRASNLLENPDMKWWLDKHVQVYEQRYWTKLLKASVEKEADVARGKIVGIRSLVEQLQFMAKQRDQLEERVNARRKQTASRGRG